MKKKLYLVGGGGHCNSVIDVVHSSDDYQIVGIVDKQELLGAAVCGVKVVATDEDLAGLVETNSSFLVTVGFTRSPNIRNHLFAKLVQSGAVMATVVSAHAIVSRHAKIAEGTVAMHGALVNASAVVGRNVIINSKALIEHDALVADHCHISTGAIVNGGCRVGESVFVGSNAVLAHGVSVADGTIVGAGSVVVSDITEPGVYVGNPARKIR